eukprot:COSAG01_NODE_865_length_13046_cov_7584.541206_5_plen_94_part_00
MLCSALSLSPSDLLLGSHNRLYTRERILSKRAFCGQLDAGLVPGFLQLLLLRVVTLHVPVGGASHSTSNVNFEPSHCISLNKSTDLHLVHALE